MFNPKKRKNEKSTDSSKREDDEVASNKRLRKDTLTITSQTQEVLRLERVREVIKHEFTREIKSKEMQLEQIDDRLEQSHILLNRLRYAIMAEYYNKQEQTQVMIEINKDAQNIETSLLNKEKEEQIAMHPSLKKIVGKKPSNFEEILKLHPKRTAAQNAKYGLNTKIAAEREERRLQKIREQGIVIDHTNADVKQTQLSSFADTTQVDVNFTPKPHALNASRIGNKTRCHFVVGNTSKYISNGNSQIPGHSSFTHKWLVYVQAKNPDVPIDNYIKKVRFCLHPSYRPNDIVDLLAPPFQVARRGWGEFPMRIQLFFHDKFQQKPIQLIHRVVLDTTKSGRHTLGAETVMEVWLRNEINVEKKQLEHSKHSKIIKPLSPAATVTKALLSTASPQTRSSNKPRTISLTNIKEAFDDNFMEFLDKIEETRTSICADIEKIQPTVVINEPLEAKLSNINNSPNLKKDQKSPLKRTPIQLSPYRTRTAGLASNSIKANILSLPASIKNANVKLETIISEIKPTTNTLEKSKSLHIKNQASTSKTLDTPPAESISASVTNTLSSKIINSTITDNIKKINLLPTSTSVKAFANLSGTVILPVTKPQTSTQYSNQTNKIQTNQIINNFTANSVFQKKTVKIIDAQGKVKTVQMLIATAKPNLPIQGSSTNVLGGNTIQNTKDTSGNSNTNSYLKSNLVTEKPLIIKPITNLKSIPTLISNEKNSTVAATTISNSKLKNNKTSNTSNISPVKISIANNATKNVVFQKEGKLYIIDPQQVKLKQQQKNQVSLLKPQIKQQQQNINLMTTIPTDHDYLPLPQKLPINVAISNKTNETEKFSKLQNTETAINTQIPKSGGATILLRQQSQLQFGVRNMRLNVIETQKLRRIQFEKKFYRLEFSSMRSAIEYLLRRLPLIVFDKESPAAAFPFAHTIPKDFQNLPAMKQRSCEWLRAKFILRLMHNLPSLQKLNQSKVDIFWTTREIAKFARCFAYTPPIKPLLAITAQKVTEPISVLIKNEMENEKLQLEHNTLCPAVDLQNWLNNIQQHLQKNQINLNNEEEEEVIIVDNNADNKAKSYIDVNVDATQHGTNKEQKNLSNSKSIITKRIHGSPLKFENKNSNISYLPPLARLETAFQFVGELCKDFSTRLESEEIERGIVHPLSQTLLAHTLKVFVDRLLRQTLANQTQQKEILRPAGNVPEKTVDQFLTAQDVRKAIINSPELDFLTNRNLGISNKETIKRE